MKNIRKCSAVMKICDGLSSRPHLKDFVMFEDFWISESDKILYNKNNEPFLVLGFEYVEEDTIVMPIVTPYHKGLSCLGIRTFSCVKLDKHVNIGDIFYTRL